MSIFGALFVSVFGAIASYLATFVARKVAIAGTAIAALATITGVLLVAMNSLVTPLLSQLFSTSYGQALGLAFPPVAGSCMASIGLCWSACALYSWQRQAVALAVSA